MQIPIVVYQDEDDVYIGLAPTLHGVHSYGYTLDELDQNMQEAIDLYFQTASREEVPKKVQVKTLNYA